MAPLELFVLILVAFATSMLSAVVGFGGGVVLLAALATTMDPLDAIVVQGAVQLAGNLTRAQAHRRSIAWPVVVRVTLLVIPGSLLGLLVARDLDASTLRILMGSFVLIITWWPGITAELARHTRPTVLLVAGALTGFGNVTIGATGPVLAPLFRAATADRLSFVGTFAAAQTIGHAVKLLTLGGGGEVPVGDHLALIAAGIVAVIVGTRVGTALLLRVSEARFGQIQRGALTLLGLRLVVEPIL